MLIGSAMKSVSNGVAQEMSWNLYDANNLRVIRNKIENESNAKLTTLFGQFIKIFECSVFFLNVQKIGNIVSKVFHRTLFN